MECPPKYEYPLQIRFKYVFNFPSFKGGEYSAMDSRCKLFPNTPTQIKGKRNN